MIFINQVRDKIGGMGYGPNETTTGGRALKFYSSIRLDVRRIGSVKQGENIIGNEVKVKVTKNKVAPPFKEVKFEIMYGKGISRVGEVLDMAIEQDVVAKSGAWFSYGDTRLGQGRENVKQKLEDEPELLKEIEAKLLDKAPVNAKEELESEFDNYESEE
jgi:recombination protein RecA